MKKMLGMILAGAFGGLLVGCSNPCNDLKCESCTDQTTVAAACKIVKDANMRID